MGKIVATTASTQAGYRKRYLNAGCDHFLPKPYLSEDLIQLLAPLREQPLYSTFLNDSSMSKIINEFVAELPAKIRLIQEAILNEDTADMLSMVRDLKGAGSGYGFAVITEAAAKVESVLQEESDDAVDAAREAIEQLVKLCLQAKPNPQN